MKLTKCVFGLFLLCNLMISCESMSNDEDDTLYFTEDVSATDEPDIPPIDPPIGG